jgi:hypothetical protein
MSLSEADLEELSRLTNDEYNTPEFLALLADLREARELLAHYLELHTEDDDGLVDFDLAVEAFLRGGER